MAEVTDSPMTAKETSPTEEAPRVAENLEPNTAALVAKSAGDSLEEELAELNGKDEEGIGLDELSSLEQEIAKLHNIRPVESASTAADAASACSGGPDNDCPDARAVGEDLTGSSQQQEDRHDLSGNGQSSTSPLEEVDLIALLKGTDTSHEQTPGNEKCALEKALSELDSVEVDVGVTIEGEGQYEIMEIDDVDSNGGESTASKASPKSPKVKSSKSTLSSPSAAFHKPKLSAEEIRAVALEQMAGLKSAKSRRKEQTPVSVVVKPKDIVSSLNEDWDDYEDSEEETPAVPPAATKLVVAHKPPQVPAKKLPSPCKPAPTSTSPGFSNKISGVKVMLKTVTQKQIEATTAKEKPKPSVTALPAAKVSAEPVTAGCKRVIKRKIIWDPDAPETQKSFAQYASSSKGAATSSTTALASPSAASTPPSSTSKTAKPSVKNVLTIQPSVAAAPSPLSPSKATKNVKKDAAIKKPRAATPTVGATKASTPVGAAERGPSPIKRRSQTPNSGLANGGPQKKKKVTEIDRLMGDEGAANMIHAVEHEQREMSGGEISNKPLMRKRAMTITGRNQTSRASAEPPIATPKKETASHSTPKSAKRTSTAANAIFAKTTPKTPTAKPRDSDSWDYVYKQRASEESMIMRRRSNSSFSSNTSVSRHSLDNKPGAGALSDDAVEASEGSDPSFKFLKPVDKANQRGVEASPACSTSHTLANDMKAVNSGHSKPAAAELVVLHKVDKVAHLKIHTHRGKTGQTYSSQLLQKLTETLSSVARSSDFNTVLLTVQGQQFCQGIECQELVQGSAEKRRNSASQLNQALKTYLRTLATFPKPLVAGIVGNLTNLGVMQLPLVDYVVAAEDCSFETNYAKLGQLPEGYALWHGHEKVTSQVHSHLLLLGERLLASDVLGPNSFVDKTCKARSVVEEALTIAKHISTTSAETYRSLKKINHLVINAAKFPRLDEEFKVIAEQWTSSNCLASMKRYLSAVDF
ncbi:nucleolar and coiled-body phosphoprotein 1 [Drosophila kikkawai]|uniref:Nucleolar and coiled-body phosphoprotein 1 n=1 Tax=Drosophila kikkawai TaxID=30033 RepID=A0A6P4J2A0_DROKI|nr:nucleolar protein dao-5 [Drosophila kikkawai]